MKQLIPHFIQEQFLAGRERGAFEAYTMFIDLSGFTPLTETLMQKGNEGAEQLSSILNDIFGPMVSAVYRQNGFIPHFAGDAFNAIFPISDDPDQPMLFMHTAQEIRDFFSNNNFRFGNFPIGLKMGLSVGPVEWGIIGNDRKTYYFRGEGIARCTECQMRASQQEIVLDEKLKMFLPKGFPVIPYAGKKDYFLFAASTYKELPLDAPVKVPEIDEATALHFLPESIIQYNEQGEFRNVISIFCSFTGVDNHTLLDQFVSVFLDATHNYSGYFKEVDFGDKGGVLAAFFGAPVTFENNIERALEFVAIIQDDLMELQRTTSLSYRIGITSGVAYTGIVGGSERCQYAAVGNRVNLAARLMTYADWGEVLVDQEIQKDRHFTFQHKGDIRYKGVPGPVPTFQLIGRNIEMQPAFSGSMIGRKTELNNLLKFSNVTMQEGKGRVAIVFGEAGIGKSRLLYELRQQIDSSRGFNWFTAISDQILQKPFNPFIYFLKHYFNQSPEKSVAENLSAFEKRFQWLAYHSQQISHPDGNTIQKEIVRTKPILAALVGLKTSHSIWNELDAKGRYENTIASITNLFLAESLLKPLVIEIEDGHWLDSNSKDFFKEFIPRLGQFPIILVVTSRYEDDGTRPQIISKTRLEQFNIPLLEIDLNILSRQSLREFTETYLKGPISGDFFLLLQRTTNGNPFYLEQLLEYFTENDLLEKVDDNWHIEDNNIKLSNSIHALLTARIDRLSSLVKETVKAAAVIGREFEVPVLSEVMRQQEAFLTNNDNPQHLLQEQIKTAENSQIWRAINELRYIFKHSLLREAVYDMQLRTRLRELHHLIAEAIEKVYADQIEQHFVDLAFHYEHAEMEAETREYLLKAADHARHNFQNNQALHYYNKLLQHLRNNQEEVEEFKVLLKKGKVLELIGEWEECLKIYNKALAIAQEQSDKLLLGRSNNALGHLLLLQGAYKDARLYLELAARFFEDIRDQYGISKVYGDLGNLYFRQGEYEEAKSNFIRSIQLHRKLPESSATNQSQIVANLGLTFMNQGQYEEGIQWLEQELVYAEQTGNKQAMASLYTNLGIICFEKGDYDKAKQCYEKGLPLAEELGNKQLTSIAMGCLGSVYEKQGNYEKAMTNFQRDLELAEELGDRQGTAIALSLLGELYSVIGRFDEAVEKLHRTLSISESLGYQKGIAKAVNTLGDVYYFTGQYDKAVSSYQRAIEGARQINNKLVLGNSLYEIGLVFLAMNRLEDTREAYEEAQHLAEELGNPDLRFDIRSLGAQLLHGEGKKEEAIRELNSMLSDAQDAQQEAEVHYQLYRVTDSPASRAQALIFYRRLYEETPKFVYKERIDRLQP